MRNVQRQRVLEWVGALVLALPFVMVSALEANARAARIQQSEQNRTVIGGVKRGRSPGGEAHLSRLNPGR